MHTVQSAGYHSCPEFHTLAEARAVLTETVADELKRAKRKSDQATKHKLGKDNYSITLGNDRRSNLWSAHWIQS